MLQDFEVFEGGRGYIPLNNRQNSHPSKNECYDLKFVATAYGGKSLFISLRKKNRRKACDQ